MEEIKNSALNIETHVGEFISEATKVINTYNEKLNELEQNDNNAVQAYQMLVEYRKNQNSIKLNGSFRADLGAKRSEEEIQANKEKCEAKIKTIIETARQIFGGEINEKNIEESLTESAKPVNKLINDCKKDLKQSAQKTNLTINSCIYVSPDKLTDGKMQTSKNVLNIAGELGDFVFAQACTLNDNPYLLRKSGKGVYQDKDLCIPGDPDLFKVEDEKLLLTDPAYIYLMKTDNFEPVVSVGKNRDGKAGIKFDGEWTSDKDVDLKDMEVKEITDVTEMLEHFQIYTVPDKSIVAKVDKCKTQEEKIKLLQETEGVKYRNQECNVNVKIKPQIDRYSKFSDLEDNSKNDKSEEYMKKRDITGMSAINKCKDIMGQHYFDEKTGELQNCKQFLIQLYYQIGIIDYKIANNCENLGKLELLNMLKERATMSAALQYFKDDYLREYASSNVKKAFEFPDGTKKVLAENIPDFWYHGRVKSDEELSNPEKEVTYETLSKKDKNSDKYYTRDGMLYVTDYEHAQKYASGEKKKKEVPEEKQHIIEIPAEKDENKYLEIFESNGHIPFIFQDEIYKMSREGNVKWLIQSPEISAKSKHIEAMDITNFADFVDWRDSRIIECLQKNGLELPDGTKKYDEYMAYLDKEMNIEKFAINISKGIAAAFAKKEDVVLKEEKASDIIKNLEEELNRHENIKENEDREDKE